jgi:hypothetical protein
MLLRQGLPPQYRNKLRDVEPEYADSGHVFEYRGFVLVSYEICGPCEAHAALTYLAHTGQLSASDQQIQDRVSHGRQLFMRSSGVTRSKSSRTQSSSTPSYKSAMRSSDGLGKTISTASGLNRTQSDYHALFQDVLTLQALLKQHPSLVNGNIDLQYCPKFD